MHFLLLLTELVFALCGPLLMLVVVVVVLGVTNSRYWGCWCCCFCCCFCRCFCVVFAVALAATVKNTPPPRPTNAVSKEHFRSDRIFGDLINSVLN